VKGSKDVMSDTQCPVCSSKLETAPVDHQRYDASIYDCPQCGQYVLENLAEVDRNLHDSKQLISAWIQLQNKRGNNRPFISVHFSEEDWFKNLRNMGFPQTVNEKLDGLLKAYADIVKDDYHKIVKAIQYPTLISAIGGKDYEQIKGLNKLLAELDYLWSEPSHPNEHVRITAKGWQRITELNKSISTSNSAFIAMWFDPQTNDCREAIKEAVTACGYNPVIVDDCFWQVKRGPLRVKIYILVHIFLFPPQALFKPVAISIHLKDMAAVSQSIQ